jgi:phospholipid/cholesterol/gamma-HCH transport system substrate-binding protein
MARGKLSQGEQGARQVRVIVVILIALIVLGYAVYQVGRLFDVFSERYPLVTLVESTAGLIEGAPVAVAGQRVGQVAEVRFIPVEERRGTANIYIRMSVSRSVRDQIREDSRAQLRTQGLLGDRLVDISPGSPGYAVLEPGDTIPAESPLDYEAVLQTAANTLDKVQRIVMDLEAVTGGLASGEGTLGALLVDDRLYDRMTTATTEMAGLLREVNRSDGTLARLIRDPALYDRMDQALVRLDSLGAVVLEGEGTLGRLVRDDSLYQSLLGVTGRADSTLAGIGGFLESVNQGEGSLARLMEDPALYDELLKTIVDLQALVAALRENPEALSPRIRVF